MHTAHFLLKLFLLALLIFSTLWLQVPATVFSVLLALCHMQKLYHVPLSLRMPIMFNLDRRTDEHTVRQTPSERTNVGLAHARPQ